MKAVAIQGRRRRTVSLYSVILMFTLAVLPSPSVSAQQAEPAGGRRALQKVAPIYPPLAKRLQLTGTVRVAVKVAANGRVLSAEVVGGHPSLADAALDAVRQWRYETSPHQTSETAVVTFTH